MSALVRMIKAKGGAVDQEEWETTQRIMEESTVKYAEVLKLADTMRNQIKDLERELDTKPTEDQIKEWKAAVQALSQANAQIKLHESEIQQLRADLAKRPEGTSTEKEKIMQDAISALHNKLLETQMELTLAVHKLAEKSGPSNGESTSRSIIKDPVAFDGSKPEEFWVWEKAVRGKIKGDGAKYFRNLDTTWEYLCGTVKGKVAIMVRTLDYKKFEKKDEDVIMGNTDTVNQAMVMDGFTKCVYEHFGNPVLFIQWNKEYQRCSQKGRPFRVYYQELSLVAYQLGHGTETEDFKGRLKHNIEMELKLQVLNRNYTTVAEAVKDMMFVDGQLRALKEGRSAKTTIGKSDEPTREQLEKEIKALKANATNTKEDTPAKAAKKEKRKHQEPGSINEPCPQGDNCRFKDKGTCWRQH